MRTWVLLGNLSGHCFWEFQEALGSWDLPKMLGRVFVFFWNPFDIGFRAMEFRLHLFALVPFEILVNM